MSDPRKRKGLGTRAAIRADIHAAVETHSDKLLVLMDRVHKRVLYNLDKECGEQKLPSEDCRETITWYLRCWSELQRYIASQPVKPSTLTDEDIEAELELNFRERLRRMTASERREAIQKIEHEPERGPEVHRPNASVWEPQ